MKKVHLLIVMVVFALAACQPGNHTRVVTNINGRYIKLEYAGNILLTDDLSAIRNISPGGFVRYETNDEKIVARRDLTGDVYYEYNGEKQATLNAEGKRLIALAVKEIAKRAH